MTRTATRSRPKPSADLALVRAALDEHGFAVVEQAGGLIGAVNLACDLGTVIPQYDGNVTHEVRVRPSVDATRQQALDPATGRTHAPGWELTPTWVALFCHRQAQSGGQIDLVDIEHVLPRLTSAQRDVLREPMWFPASPATRDRGVRAPMLTRDRHGRRVLRFSHNLLTTGRYDTGSALEAGTPRLPLGEAGADLARTVHELTPQVRSRITLAEGALLVWDNQRMMHARSGCADVSMHLTRFFIQRTP